MGLLRRITFGVKEFQRPWIFGGVFASFCRRGQKDVAPEREISLPEARTARAAGRRERRLLRSKAPPRGAWERQRLLSPSPGACHSTPPARCVGAAARRDVHAIRCGTFLYRSRNRTREIQKPLVFGGVLFHISFAVERNMAAGGIEKKVVGPLRPKVTRARERGIFPPEGAIQAPPVADTAR